LRLIAQAALRISFALTVLTLLDLSIASAQILRVAAYNVNADTNNNASGIGSKNGGIGLTDVLKAIGQAQLADHSQPLDVLALEELNATNSLTTGYPSVTLDFLVNQMNADCLSCNYMADTFDDPTTGGTGGGPSGLIYNANTVQVLQGALKPKAIGTASGSPGAPRAPMRYTLAPVGYNNHTADFTLYVSHMKANTSSNNTPNITRRNFEAGEIRDDAATLGASAHIIYAGDYNILNSSESTFQTMIAPNSPTAQINAGQAVDTLNPANSWNQTSAFKPLFTESANSLTARFDFQLVTGPMVSQTGMQLVPGTLTSFGNDGLVSNVSNPSNTALADLGTSPYTPAYRTSILTDLTTATDHLPIVADYSFSSVIIPGDYDHSGLVDNADYDIWTSSFGSIATLDADGNANGIVDASDYTVWRDHLGSSISGAGAGGSVPIPEPSSAALLVVGICLVGFWAARLRG
jgi:hypothetical protein